MCGRYFVLRSGESLAHFIKRILRHLRSARRIDLSRITADAWPEHRRHFNVTPTSHMPIVRVKNGEAVVELAHWQILPTFAGDRMAWRTTSEGERSFKWLGRPLSHFNSRKDTLLQSDSWRDLLDTQRCLVPADGFIEWPDDALRDKTQPKTSHAYSLSQGQPLVFAGIYAETLDPEGKPFLSFNIISVEPNALLRGLPHHRMPAILPEEDAAAWLDPALDWRGAAQLLQPYPEQDMRSHALGDAINSGLAEAPELLHLLETA